MGIEQFFTSIIKEKAANIEAQFAKVHREKVKTSYFYIDFNSIIHVVSRKIIADLNYVLMRVIARTLDPEHTRVKSIMDRFGIGVPKSAKEFHKEMTEDVVSGFIINEVVQYLLLLLEFYLDPEELEHVYIAIDGTPHKPKMVEQRKRRFLGVVGSRVRDKLFEKYKSELKKDPEKYQFEKYKIIWNKVLISPGTVFMHKMYKRLVSDELKGRIQQVCPKLKWYICSGPYEPGEGEKKIVNHMMSLNFKENKFVIYSPDSDMILLAMMINDNFSSLRILKHDQQEDKFDVVDVDLFNRNLLGYVRERVGDKELVSRAVIDDIVCILTVFGDDFLPKVESFNVRFDFAKVIDIYIDAVLGDDVYLIEMGKGGKKKLNQHVLTKLLFKFQENERENLVKTFVSANHHNYRRLRDMMGADQDNFVEIMKKFLGQLRKLHHDIRKGLEVKPDRGFVDKLLKLSKMKSLGAYIEYYRKNKKFPRVQVVLKRFSRSLERNQFYQKMYLKDHDGTLNMSKFDEEVFKFNNMLDEYQKLAQAYPIDLGKVYIDGEKYTWNEQPIEKAIEQYYKMYFEGATVEKVAMRYLQGLLWIFDYYYNQYDVVESRTYASYWFYPYDRAPLMTDVYGYLSGLKDGELDVMSDGLSNYVIHQKDFFNCIEQLMWITPASSVLSIIPEEYRDWAVNSGYYPDMDKLAEDFLKGKRVIDCKGAKFMGKCFLVYPKPPLSDTQFIKELRAIPLGKESLKRRGGYQVENKTQERVKFYQLYRYFKNQYKQEKKARRRL